MIGLSMIPNTRILGKVVRLPLRLLPGGLVVPVLRGPLRGKKWIVGSYNHGCWLGIYEQEFQQRLKSELRPNAVFYDIGANVGFYTLLGSSLVGAGSVISFEPLPENVRFLKAHLKLNAVQNVQVMPMAISDSKGMATFLTESTRGMGRLDSAGTLRVRMDSIDHLVNAGVIPPPDCLKVDVEGSEFNVLSGAMECFRRFQPVLFLATHGVDQYAKCCELLRGWGYDVTTCTASLNFDRAELLAKPRVAAEVHSDLIEKCAACEARENHDS